MKKNIILISLTVLLFSACDTRREIHEDKGLWTRIAIDWSEANIDPNGASIWIFPHDGREPIVVLTNDTKDSVRLRKGEYSLLVFNETVSEHQFIEFRGTDNYSTFAAYCKPLKTSNKYVKAGDNTASSPNVLASASYDNLTITREMIESDSRPSLTFKSKRVVSLVNVVVHIEGVDNAARSGSALSLSGMAEGVNLSTGKTLSTSVRHMAILNNRTYYPGDLGAGTMSSSFYSFGLTDMLTKSSGTQNVVMFYFKLRDGSDFPAVERNVTNIIERTDGMQIIFNITMGAKGTPEITLPYVPDADLPGSGFDAEVEDWGEVVNIDIPI